MIVFLAIFATENRFAMNHDIFISYSSKQKNIADGVCHYLEEKGYKCWMAPRDIPIGSEYGDLIEQAIKKSKLVVLVFSQTASMSKWVKGEINVAFTEDKPILPFRVDDTEIKGTFRVMLNQMHWIDAFPRFSDKLPDLEKSICGILGQQVTTIDHNVNKPQQKKKFPVWAILLLLAVVIGASVLLVSKYSHSINEKKEDKNIEALVDSETIIRNTIQNLCTAIEKNEFDSIANYYADQVKRYHNLYDVTKEEVVNRYMAYDEKFQVKKKYYNIRWNTLKIWDNSNGWTVEVVMDYHINRVQADYYTTYELEKHYEFDKDYRIVSDYNVELGKSKI